jgi:PAS domain S-box-containing protein
MAKKPTYEELEHRVKQLGKAEEALRESEEKLSGIVDSVTDHMSMIDEQHNIVWGNDVAKGLFGPDLVGKKCYSAYHRHEKPCEPCIVKKCFEDGNVHEHETEVIGADGNRMLFWCIANVAARYRDGRPKTVVEISRNITELKRAEDTLRESTRRMEVAHAQSIIYAKELNEKITEHKRGEDALQKAHDELEGRIEERTAELARTTEQLKLELTERKQAEEALRKSEGKYRTLLEHLPQKIFHKDGNSVYVSCNQNYARDLKIKPEEIKGKTDHDFFPKKLAKKYRADDKRIIKSSKTENIEEKYIQDGQEIWVQTAKTPIKDEKGNVTGILGIFWDITQRKQAEEALRQREAALEVRTNQLEEVNSALRVLLKQRDNDKTELEEEVMLNVKELVLPYIEKLKRRRLDAKSMAYLSVLESNLNDIVSPFAHKLSSKHSSLTPAEIQIAHLVRDGRTTKEMAEFLNVSRRTIDSHRQNIRMKVGLHGKKANLRSHLLSM